MVASYNARFHLLYIFFLYMYIKIIIVNKKKFQDSNKIVKINYLSFFKK